MRVRTLSSRSSSTLVKPAERFGAGLRAQRPQAIQGRMGLAAEIELVHPAIRRVGPAFDQPARLELVDMSHQRHRRHLQDVGKSRLGDSLVAFEPGKNLPLRAGEIEFLGPAIEIPGQQTRGVGNQEADAALGLWFGHGLLTLDDDNE